MNPSLIAIAAVVVALSGCAELSGGRQLSRSPEIPAAEGVVKFKTIAGDDTAIDLRVTHLAEPDQLSRPGYTYVAWVRETEENLPQNVGALNLGRDRKGVLKAVTPLHRFAFFVTAEATSDAEQPTGEPLLWASRD